MGYTRAMLRDVSRKAWAAFAGTALLLDVAAAAGQGELPERLDVHPPPPGLATPDALLEEARQAADRVVRSTSGQNLGRFLQDTHSAVLLQRALATIDSRWWPTRTDSDATTPSFAVADTRFLTEAKLGRARALALVEDLAAAHPDQARALLDHLPAEMAAQEAGLRSRVAYHAAMGAAAGDPARATELAAAIRDESLRGMAWDRIGQIWLRRGSWNKAFTVLESTTGAGRVSLFAAMVRQAGAGELDRLERTATTPELKVILVEVAAHRDPEMAWELTLSLRGTPHFFGAAVTTAAALARSEPAQALEALEAALGASPVLTAALLPTLDELAPALARAPEQLALALAERLRQAGAAEGVPATGDECLARLAAGVAASDVRRSAILLSLVRDPVHRQAGWETAGSAAVVRGLAEAESLAGLAPDPQARSWCLAGAARHQLQKDAGSGFALTLRVPDPVVRADLLAGVETREAQLSAAALGDALADTARELVVDYRREGARGALGLVLRRMARLDGGLVLRHLESTPEPERWRDLFANHVGPVDPALSERLSPEVGRYWSQQAALRQLQQAAERDPRAAIRHVQMLRQPSVRQEELYRSRALAAAGRALALRDTEAAVQLADQISDLEERAHYLVALSGRMPLERFGMLIAAARALPEEEWRARALGGIALSVAAQTHAAARTEAALRAQSVEGRLGAYRAAAFAAPELAETHYNLARALATAGKQRESRDHFRRFMELRPETPLASALAHSSGAR